MRLHLLLPPLLLLTLVLHALPLADGAYMAFGVRGVW
jgi:hypothetical protein